MNEEVVITAENFDEYFHDVRQHGPKKGEVMACYTSKAEFVDGPEKAQMVHLLKQDNKAQPAAQVMRKLLFASELDAYRVPQAMIQDMLDGMSDEEVRAKSYPYTVEIFYYAKPEHVPEDDPHWTIIEILNLDQFLDTRDAEASGKDDSPGE